MEILGVNFPRLDLAAIDKLYRELQGYPPRQCFYCTEAQLVEFREAGLLPPEGVDVGIDIIVIKKCLQQQAKPFGAQ